MRRKIDIKVDATVFVDADDPVQAAKKALECLSEMETDANKNPDRRVHLSATKSVEVDGKVVGVTKVVRAT